MSNNILQCITTLLPPVPDAMVNMIFFNCTKGCDTNSGCRQICIKCLIICGYFRDQLCFNLISNNVLDDNIDDHYECEA